MTVATVRHRPKATKGPGSRASGQRWHSTRSRPLRNRPEATVLAVEARGLVRRAVAELPVRRRALIGTLFGEAEVRYADVSRVLDIPPGSIGPTRGRVLRMLRQALEQDGLTEVRRLTAGDAADQRVGELTSRRLTSSPS